MSRIDKKDAKSINVDQVINYLNHSFAKMAENVFASRAAVKGAPLYKFQIKHCYFVDEIKRGPTYMLPKVISNANDNIVAMKEWEKEQESE